MSGHSSDVSWLRGDKRARWDVTMPFRSVGVRRLVRNLDTLPSRASRAPSTTGIVRALRRLCLRDTYPRFYQFNVMPSNLRLPRHDEHLWLRGFYVPLHLLLCIVARWILHFEVSKPLSVTPRDHRWDPAKLIQCCVHLLFIHSDGNLSFGYPIVEWVNRYIFPGSHFRVPAEPPV
ncbi:hypothetical protein BC834DRAFT_561007 [Gloeopeniophorella convolvens]|nr:hypothetical protein BC834DRAFT_561007 [Gloeopeniophorella convolvens]